MDDTPGRNGRGGHHPAHLASRDHTVWRADPEEISDRLGWLDCAQDMLARYGESHADAVSADQDMCRAWSTDGSIRGLVEAVRAEGYSDVLLLGMGGSSLAPELFGRLWGAASGGLALTVLDSTDADTILARTQALDPARTLVLVSSKSGGTVETRTLFQHARERARAASGESAGAHFVAITDPDSALVELAQEHDFRAVFLNAPNIGGRYSALSYFGLLPAALAGVDVPALLERALAMARGCQLAPQQNPGAWFGAVLGSLARAGRDKLTLVCSPQLRSLGDWIEQLIAESTGKEGTGILPVVHESLARAGGVWARTASSCS